MKIVKLICVSIAVLAVCLCATGLANAAQPAPDPVLYAKATSWIVTDLKCNQYTLTSYTTASGVTNFSFVLSDGRNVTIAVTAAGLVNHVEQKLTINKRDITRTTDIIYGSGNVVLERRDQEYVYGNNKKLDEYTLNTRQYNSNGTVKATTYIRNVYGTNSKLLTSVNDRTVYTYSGGVVSSTRDVYNDRFFTNGKLSLRIHDNYVIKDGLYVGEKHETYSFQESGNLVSLNTVEKTMSYYSNGICKSVTTTITNYNNKMGLVNKTIEAHTYTLASDGRSLAKDAAVLTAETYGAANKKLTSIVTTSARNGSNKLLEQRANIGFDVNGTWTAYTAYYTVNASGVITATRVVGPDGKDVAKYSGNKYYTPETILAGLKSPAAAMAEIPKEAKVAVAGDQEVVARMSVIEAAGTNVGSKLFSNQMAVQESAFAATTGIADPKPAVK